MKRFNAWAMLHDLIMFADDRCLESKRCSQWFHRLTMRISGYCLNQMRKRIPDEFQDQLIERDDA